MPLPDSEEATQSKTLVKNVNQNFQDLLDVFMAFHDRLGKSVYEPMFQALRENQNIKNNFAPEAVPSVTLNGSILQRKK